MTLEHEEEQPTAAEGAEGKKDKMGLKVELDLDDAPFLADDEPQPEEKKKEEVPAGEPSARLPLPEQEATPPKGKKKKLALAGAAALVLLGLGIAANTFLFPSVKQPESEQVPQPAPETVVVAPKALPPAEVPMHTLQWEPFWVQLKDTEGAVRFLSCRFSTTTNNPALFAETIGKRLVLRDALFYYLENQPIISLSDEAKAVRFKEELLNVINEHLGSGKISEILLEEYLIQ